MRNKVALVGSGYIGKVFYDLLEGRNYEVTLVRRGDNFMDAVKWCDLVINAAGYGGDRNVDDCDKNRGKTMFDNVLLPLFLRDACQLYGKPMIHVSSGCIFNGERLRKGDLVPWTEKDTPNFTFRDKFHSFYTGSKYLAEQILGLGAMIWICRLRMPFSRQAHPRNLITKLAQYPIIMCEQNSLSEVEESVAAMIQLYEKNVDYGVYHVVNTGAINTLLCHQLISKKLKIALPTMDTDSFYIPLMEERRSNAVLSNEKLLRAGIKMKPVEQAFRQTLEAYR